MVKGTFTVKIDDKNVDLKIINITNEIRLESQKHYARVFNEGVDSGLMLRVQVEKMLESKGLLDTSVEETKADTLREKIKIMEMTLRRGVLDDKRMTKEQGKQLAMNLRKERAKLSEIGSNLSKYFNNTVESVADNERIQYFIYACTVLADTGERFWKTFDAFKTDETNLHVLTEASKMFMSSALGLDQDTDKLYYENRWLIKMGFMNDKLHLIDSTGRLIDEEGRYVDDDGYYIDKAGERVDIYGNKVDKEGNLLEDSWNIAPKPIEKVPETTTQITTISPAIDN